MVASIPKGLENRIVPYLMIDQFYGDRAAVVDLIGLVATCSVGRSAQHYGPIDSSHSSAYRKRPFKIFTAEN